MLAVVAFVVLVTATSGVLCAHWLYPPWRPRRSATTRKDPIT
ncbi:hypothetical protein [Streptomyces sp. NPDC058299]